MADEQTPTMPSWQCHKVVQADKIKAIRSCSEAEFQGMDDTKLRLDLECGLVIVVTKDLFARGAPSVGDYFVQYADNYQSWSPADAFEEGYTLNT